MNKKFLDEMSGLEFDWYAMDKNGYIALMCTMGECQVPDIVADNYTDHIKISELISVQFGYGEWQRYQQLGFYVYDWKPYGGPYQKQGNPTTQISLKLRDKLLSITDLPRYAFNFSETHCFAQVQMSLI